MLSSAWMMGAGLRFMLMTDDMIYKINEFDRLFDWGILFLLGLLLLSSTAWSFLKSGEKTF